MKELYLEVTFHAGEPLAAYLYLPRNEGDRSARLKKHGAGLLVDLAEDGRPIGIEIAIPALMTVEAVNQILESYGLNQIDEAELAPLKNSRLKGDSLTLMPITPVQFAHSVCDEFLRYIFSQCRSTRSRGGELGSRTVSNLGRQSRPAWSASILCRGKSPTPRQFQARSNRKNRNQPNN